MRLWFGFPALALLLAGSGCDSSSATTCTGNDDCLQGGVSGICRPSPRSADSFCAFPDPECPSPPALRWGVLAGDDLAKTCVDVEMLADGGLDSGTDGGPPAEFAFRVGGADGEILHELAVADDGAPTLVGYFGGTTDLGGGPVMSAGLEDAFIARYDASHAHTWSNRYGGSSSDFASTVATVANGDIIFAGRASGTIDFGGGPFMVGTRSLFVARFTATGEHVWSKVYESGSAFMGQSQRLAIDAEGNVFVVGDFTGTAKFGMTTLTSMIFPDVFLVKLEGTSGNVLWAKQFGGGATDKASAISTQGELVAIGGSFRSSASFGGATFTAAGDVDGFVAVFNGSAGSHVWSKQLGGTGATVEVTDVQFDVDSAVYVSGAFLGTMDPGGGQFTSAGDYDGYVARYSNSGGHAWSRRVGGTSRDRAESLAIDAAGLTVVGTFEQMAEIAGTTLTSRGSSDVFILRLSKANAPRSTHQFGGTGTDDFPVVRIGSQTYVAGTFAGTATLDAGKLPLASTDGNADLFVLGLNLP